MMKGELGGFMKNWTLTQTLMPLIFLASLSVVACNKSDGGGTAATPGVSYLQNCGNCQLLGQGTGLLTSVKGQTADGGLQFSVDLMGQGTYYGGGYGNPKAVVSYQGAAAFAGFMRVNNPQSMCGAPAGDYGIRPLQLSNMYALTVQGGQYEAIGPGNFRIVFRIANAIFYNTDGGGVSSASPNNRVNLNLMIDFAGGYSCGSISTY
jgi:hypothetical protein